MWRKSNTDTLAIRNRTESELEFSIIVTSYNIPITLFLALLQYFNL